MGDNIEKNSINLLPEDLKKEKSKKAKKEVETEDVFEPDLVLPDSEKLKKQRTTSISGSNVSFLQKISDWFSSRFKKVSHKEPEIPRIQELQEMVGKSQHVGEVLIDDEEVVPDRERDRVVTQESIKKEEVDKSDDKYPSKEKDDVIFVTKPDHEAELAKQKEVEVEKNKVEPIPINQDDRGLKRDKKFEEPKSDDGVYSMPQTLADIDLPEPEEDLMADSASSKSSISSSGVSIVTDNKQTSASGPSWWDKFKMFLAGIFGHKEDDKQPEEKTNDQNKSVLFYELNKAAEEGKDEYELSTPTENFVKGVNVMPVESSDENEKSKEPEALKEPNVFEGTLDKGIKNEELSKAQEELLAEPEDLGGVEDMFSALDDASKDKEDVPEISAVETKDSFWQKIKDFFAHLFAPKPKELNIEKPAPEIEAQAESEPEQVPEPEVELTQPESVPEVELTKPESLPEIEAQAESEPELVPEPEVELTQPEPELKEPAEKVQLTGPLDQGFSESLPTSITQPNMDSGSDLDVAVNDLTNQENQLETHKKTNNFWQKIKDFFAHLFKPRAKVLDLEQHQPEAGSNKLENTPTQNVLDSNEGGLVELGVVPEEKLVDKKTQEIDEYELATKFHQPQASTVTRLIDQEGGVDLIPIAVRTKSWPQIIQLLVAAVVGSIIILASFYAILFIQQDNLEQQKIEKESQISTIEKTILDYESVNKDIEKLGLEIETVYNLINKHIYWTNLFTMLEKYTISDVYYNGFAAGNGGALSLSAAGKSYDSAARQLKLLQSEEAKEFIQSVSINSVSGGETGVIFSINLVLNDDLFYYDHTKVLWIIDLPAEVNEDDLVEMALRKKIDEFRTEIKNKGYKFFLATSLTEGLALAETEAVDVILLDIDLPKELSVEHVYDLEVTEPVYLTEDEYELIQRGYNENSSRLRALLEDKEIEVNSGLLGVSVNGEVFKIHTNEEKFGEPEINYYSTKMVKWLRKSSIVRGASIIMYAGQDKDDELDEAKEFGSAGYIYKDTDKDDMFYIVDEELKNKNKYLQ